MRAKDLEYVLDWMAIQELMVEYGHAVDYGLDTGDWTRWMNVFTPQLTADYTRFLGGEPMHIPREQLVERVKKAMKPFSKLQHSTATSVKIHFKSATQAEVLAYAEVGHYFSTGGVQQEWTLAARYSHEVEKTAEGWRIRKYSMDPIHYRGNPLGLDLMRGKRHA
jgi:hypothetical protein